MSAFIPFVPLAAAMQSASGSGASIGGAAVQRGRVDLLGLDRPCRFQLVWLIWF
jgi:hypothetical protein